MELVYRVSDTEEKVFELDIEDLDLEELGLIETYSGKTYEQIMESLGKGRGVFSILRPFLFVYLRRENPDIAYRDVKPKLRQLRMRPSLDELEAMYERVNSDKDYPNREQLLAELRDDIAEARARGASGKDDATQTRESSSTAPSRRRGSGTVTAST